jgi:N-acetylneuraminic acid mutarotase
MLTASRSLYVFDVETETISTLSAGAWAYYYTPAVAVGTKIYLFGGYAPSVQHLPDRCTTAIRFFDTETETYTTLSAVLPTKSCSISAVAVGTKIYLFGGEYNVGSSTNNRNLKTINVFDTETETISTLDTTLQDAAYNIASALVGTRAYLFGGYGDIGYLNTINKFIVKFPLQTNTLHIQSTTAENIFTMIDAGNITVQMGVKEAYIGNSDGYAKKVEAALYKNGGWTNI